MQVFPDLWFVSVLVYYLHAGHLHTSASCVLKSDVLQLFLHMVDAGVEQGGFQDRWLRELPSERVSR